MARNVQDIDRGWRRIINNVRAAHRQEVVVGVLEGSKNGEGASIAEYGAYNEFGATVKNAFGKGIEVEIPSRPFMRTSFDENRSDINADIDAQGRKLVSGEITARAALTIIGLKHKSRIQNTITGRDFLPKLADETIRRKKGSTKTLVDTGALVNAIQISVRSK